MAEIIESANITAWILGSWCQNFANHKIHAAIQKIKTAYEVERVLYIWLRNDSYSRQFYIGRAVKTWQRKTLVMSWLSAEAQPVLLPHYKAFVRVLRCF